MTAAHRDCAACEGRGIVARWDDGCDDDGILWPYAYAGTFDRACRACGGSGEVALTGQELVESRMGAIVRLFTQTLRWALRRQSLPLVDATRARRNGYNPPVANSNAVERRREGVLR